MLELAEFKDWIDGDGNSIAMISGLEEGRI